jgi:hypothetical protein
MAAARVPETATPVLPPLMEPEFVTVSAAPLQRLIGPVVPEFIVVVPTQTAALAGAGANAYAAATIAEPARRIFLMFVFIL